MKPKDLLKVIADEKTDKVLGVSMIGAVAGAMIAEASSIAMEFGASAEDIARGHAMLIPTHSESCQRSSNGS